MTINIMGADVSHAGLNRVGRYAHVEGETSQAPGPGAHAEGYLGYASGSYSHAEGYNSQATGYASHAGGFMSFASAAGAWAFGHRGMLSLGANRTQAATYTLSRNTTSTSAQVLTFDGNGTIVTSGEGTNVLTLTSAAAYVFQAMTTVRRPSTSTSTQGWLHTGLITRDFSTARMVGSVSQLAGWQDVNNGNLTFTADTANNCLAVTATPVASSSMHWFCVLSVAELVSV